MVYGQIWLMAVCQHYIVKAKGRLLARPDAPCQHHPSQHCSGGENSWAGDRCWGSTLRKVVPETSSAYQVSSLSFLFPNLLWGLVGTWGHVGQLNVSGIDVCPFWDEAVSSPCVSFISLFPRPSNLGGHVSRVAGL